MGKKQIDEPVAFAEIGSYLYENDGEATVKLQTSVNQSLKPDHAERISNIKKLRVEMHVKEDKDVQGNQVYEKNVKMKQLVNGGDSGQGEAYSGDADEPSEGHLGPLQILKNFVDNIAEDARTLRIDFAQDRTAQWIVMVALAIVAAGALVIAILR